MADIETLPEPVNDASPPDDRANAPAWITFALGGVIFLVASIGFVAIYGVPGGTSVHQQQASGTSPAPANQNAAPANAAPRETTGSGAAATPKR